MSQVQKSPITPPEVEAIMDRLVAQRRENLEFHQNYQEETLQFLCVKEGEPEKLAQIYSGHSYGRSASMGMMAQSELDQWRCAFIVAITLYTRFAIEGGLDQEIAYSLSDAYLCVVHRMDDPRAVYELLPGYGTAGCPRSRRWWPAGIISPSTCTSKSPWPSWPGTADCLPTTSPPSSTARQA